MSKILVVDDDADLLAILGEFLKMLKWEPELYSDASKALEQALSGDYPVVLFDQNMPKYRGTEIAAAMRERDSKARIIIATGDVTEDGLAQTVTQLGAELAEKPLTFETLAELLADTSKC
jgi:DNA-binding NtrC family response regulator